MLLTVCILLKNQALLSIWHMKQLKKNPLFLAAIAASSKHINNLSEEQLRQAQKYKKMTKHRVMEI